MKILNLIRYKNLLIIILTQTLVYVCLCDHSTSSFDWKIIPLVVGTLLVAAAGNIINDFFDLATDLVNRPGTNPTEIMKNNNHLLYSYFILNVMALIAGFLVSYPVGNIFLFSIIILYLYTIFLKKLPLAGNIAIAILISVTLIVISIFEHVTHPLLFFFYCFFAFITGFIREIVKDGEDIEGDRQTGNNTYPVVHGIPKTLFVIKSSLIVLLAGIIFMQIILVRLGYWFTFAYYIIAVFVPVIMLFNLTLKTANKRDFTNLSNYLKILMLAGVLSMILIKFQL